MLIKGEDIKNVLRLKNIHISGALHVGAHDCEEMTFYHSLSLKDEDVVWIDAIQEKVDENVQRGIPNVHCHVVSDRDDETITFHISNNVQSSSIQEFGTHEKEHPHVKWTDHRTLQTKTIDTFMKENALVAEKYNFWNMDIQGAEYAALQGGLQSLQHVRALYLEVNSDEVQKGVKKIDELDAFLQTLNFQRILTQMTPHGWGDALQVRS